MKKIISIILVGFILIWTYNLFINNFIQLEEVEEEPYKGIIEIWDFSNRNINTGSSYRWLQSKIQGFEKRNPGVYIDLVPANGENPYNNLMDTSIEDMPDIIPIDSSFQNFNILEPLDDYFKPQELEEFKHQILKAMNYNGELIGVPVGMTTRVMFLNLEKFSERGVTPPLNGIWAYEEFIETIERLNYDSDGDGLIDEYGFIFSVEPNNYNIWGIILSDGGEFINNKRVEYSFYGEKAIKGLEKVIDLKHKYNLVPGYIGIINEKDAWEIFYKERKAAIYITGSWAVNQLDKSYREGEGFNFDVVNFPTGDKNLPVALSNDIVSYGVIRDEDQKKMKMCVEFLKFLTTDSNQRTLEDIGLFTVKRGIKDMYEDDLKMKKIEESLSYTYYIPFMDNWNEIDAIIQGEIRKTILGEKPSYEAIEDAKIEIDKLKE